MAQRANMDMVNNLRPFIAQMIQNYLIAYEGLRLAGNNITISGGEISLSQNVEIERSLKIGPSAYFEMWDDGAQTFRQVRIESIDGDPFLVFVDSITTDEFDQVESLPTSPYSLTPGNNIDIDDGGKISLSQHVEIEGALRVGREAVFEMWDDQSNIFRQVKINSVDGVPFLYFVDSTES